MVLNNKDAAATAESIHAQPGLSSEIDLYAELLAFAKLSPDEQCRLGNRSVQSTAYGTTGEIVDAVKDVSTKEPVSEAQVSSAGEDRRSQPSGPLSSVEPPQEIIYTGAMSRGVCLACGAESDADDLFCLACGGFVDEVASSVPSTPLCKGCKHRIDPDEIFCPWCGFSAPA